MLRFSSIYRNRKDLCPAATETNAGACSSIKKSRTMHHTTALFPLKKLPRTVPAALLRIKSLAAALPVTFAAAWLSPAAPASAAESGDAGFAVLVYSQTEGFRHGSIPAGIEAVKALGGEHGFQVDATEDSGAFTPENLENYAAIVFLNTTGTLFDEEQRAALKGFIRGGGGYAGIHSAADTEYDWEWYGELVGAYFQSHPHIQEADVIVENADHPSTRHLSERWERRDEWYNYRRNPREDVEVLLSLDTDTFEGSEMTGDHPIAWYREFDGGRTWYTGGGHTNESFSEPDFLKHLLGGILWAAGEL